MQLLCDPLPARTTNNCGWFRALADPDLSFLSQPAFENGLP
jgi:hypothetical protein